jgi:DNA-binding XRE family transcriptional regulator
MRALPLTNKAKPGGRPRRSRAPSNPFALWLATCGMTPSEVAGKLGVSLSSVYNARNAYFRPGRSLAVKIAALAVDPATGASVVPVDSWDAARKRPRTRKTA